MEAGETTRVLLVRHGAVARPWRGRIYGSMDVPLSPQGQDEARRVADRLAGEPLRAVVSSGLARAEFGAALLRAPRGLPRRDDPDLAELDRGDWTGLSFDELEARSPGAWAAWLADPGRRRPPGGESLADLSARVLPSLQRLAGEHAGSQFALVTHRWVIRAVVCAVLDLDPRAAPRLEIETGGLVAVDWPVGEEPPRGVLAGFDLDRLPAAGAAPFRARRRG